MRIRTGIQFMLIMAIILQGSFCFSATKNQTYLLSEELVIQSLGEDVYLVTHHFPWPANSMLVRCSDTEMVWVDTPCTGEATEQVLKWVTAQFGNQKIIEINTGYHHDNLGGNDFLHNSSVDIYGSDLTARLLRERSESTRKEVLKLLKKEHLQRYHDAHAEAVYIPPNRPFAIEKGLNLHIGNQDVEVFYPGPSHTADNLVVYFPKKKLLFAGCMLKSTQAEEIGYTRDADMDQWPFSILRLHEKFSQAKTIVPGHGPAGGYELVWYTMTFFQNGEGR